MVCALAFVTFGAASGSEGSGKSEGSGPQQLAVALDGNCAVCAVGGKTVKGKDEFKSSYQGLEYKFPTAQIKAKFDAAPDTYAVQDMGHCKVCAVDMKKEVKGNPGIYAVHNGKIYLFVNEEVKKKFVAAPAKYTGEEAKKEEGSGNRPPRREGS
ncbi:MAG: YHS domain-containing protein [Planctomycetota bacterium]|nr:YHS domain-containing protein [Planctomycetota bacterium]